MEVDLAPNTDSKSTLRLVEDSAWVAGEGVNPKNTKKYGYLQINNATKGERFLTHQNSFKSIHDPNFKVIISFGYISSINEDQTILEKS